MKLRFGEEKDVDTIVQFVKAYASEAGGWFFDIDEDGCRIEAVRDLPNTIVVEKDNDIVGVLILEQVTIKWTKNTLLIDKLLYVKPEYRSKGVGLKLIDEAKLIADHLKMRILMSSFNGKDIDRKELLYERKGFKKVGGVYVYEPKV